MNSKDEEEIFVDTRRDRNVIIDYEKMKNKKKIKIINCEEYDMMNPINYTATIKNDNSIENNILEELSLTNINCNFTNNHIILPNLKKLHLVNSIINIDIKSLNTLLIKGSISKLNETFSNLSHNNNLKIDTLIIKIISECGNSINLNTLFEHKLISSESHIHLSLNGKCEYDTSFPISSSSLSKIVSLTLKNTHNTNIIALFAQCPHLEKFKNHDMDYKDIEPLVTKPSLLSIDVDDFPDELSYKSLQLYELDELNVNYASYSLDKLTKITLPLFEFTKKNMDIVLYGEANIEFYNEANFSFITKVVEHYSKTFKKVQLRNFDIENIDYLSKLVLSFENIESLVIDNININENFTNGINKRKIFNAKSLEVNNITFLSDEAEEAFYSIVNAKETNIESIKLRNVESISKYEFLIKKSNEVLLEEIYEIDYEYMANLLSNKKLKSLTLSKIVLDPNGEQSEMKSNQNLICKIIQSNSDTLTNLSIQLDSNITFIFECLKQTKVPFLSSLTLRSSEDSSSSEKINFLQSSILSFPSIKSLTMDLFSLSKQSTKQILTMYPSLLSIQ